MSAWLNVNVTSQPSALAFALGPNVTPVTPMNLAAPGDTADYVVTGSWGKKAAGEAKKFCNVNVAADASDRNFTYIPEESGWQRSDNAAYLHYTPNETIAGVEFHFIPDGDAPLVADMSSTILSRPIDVSRFGVIYAGAQKNIGPAGITVVIVRNDLLDRAVFELTHVDRGGQSVVELRVVVELEAEFPNARRICSFDPWVEQRLRRESAAAG